MKHIAICAAAAATLAACAGNTAPQQEQEPVVGMANPASVYCEQQGGKSETRKNADGSEYGVCRFPNGKVVDEWDFYRKNHK